MPHALVFIVELLAAAVVVVVLCRLAHLPAILGYLAVGIALGPHALGVVPLDETTRYLGEIGVVFLMFSIGLEFSLPQLHAMRRAVFGLGFAQVVITTVGAMVVLHFLDYGWAAGFVLGGALAMSSTAIVSKMLAERMELSSPHGRDVMGILIFQDLAIVAFLIIIPALGKSGQELAIDLGIAAAKAAAALALILFLGQAPMRAWFHVVARQRSPELFVLNVLLVTLGLGALTASLGLSLALGAFLAGMLIAETEYRYQVEDDIKPFRDVLLGLFFVVVGTTLDPRVVFASFGTVALLVLVPVTAKVVLVAVLARAFGDSLATSLRVSFYLGQAGELALVMLALAVSSGVLPDALLQPVLAAMIVSMCAAPVVIQLADPLVRRLTSNDWLARAALVTQIAAQTMGRQDHVLVCGYGRSGQNLARLLAAEDIGYVAIDADPQRVREAAPDGGSDVMYGDASRREVLSSAGLAKARAVVVTFTNTAVALKILHHVHQIRPDLPVIVRTVDDSEIARLEAAGAAEVVPEVLEGSLMLASHSLLVVGVPLNRVLRRIRTVREERYGLFRGFFRGATDVPDAADHRQMRLHTVVLPDRAAAIGRTLAEIGLDGAVEVTGVRRRGARSRRPDADWRFEAGDVVVLLGSPEALLAAEERLLKSRGGASGPQPA